MLNKKYLSFLLISLLILAGCQSTGGQLSGSTQDIARDSRAALQDLYAHNPEAKYLADRAKGILVFPGIVKAGFLVGAQYDSGGALLKNDKMTKSLTITISSQHHRPSSRSGIIQLRIIFYGQCIAELPQS